MASLLKPALCPSSFSSVRLLHLLTRCLVSTFFQRSLSGLFFRCASFSLSLYYCPSRLPFSLAPCLVSISLRLFFVVPVLLGLPYPLFWSLCPIDSVPLCFPPIFRTAAVSPAISSCLLTAPPTATQRPSLLPGPTYHDPIA